MGSMKPPYVHFCTHNVIYLLCSSDKLKQDTAATIRMLYVGTLEALYNQIFLTGEGYWTVVTAAGI